MDRTISRIKNLKARRKLSLPAAPLTTASSSTASATRSESLYNGSAAERLLLSGSYYQCNTSDRMRQRNGEREKIGKMIENQNEFFLQYDFLPLYEKC